MLTQEQIKHYRDWAARAKRNLPWMSEAFHKLGPYPGCGFHYDNERKFGKVYALISSPFFPYDSQEDPLGLEEEKGGNEGAQAELRIISRAMSYKQAFNDLMKLCVKYSTVKRYYGTKK